MIPPEPPQNEAARLAALRASRVLDTRREDLFDDLTILAAALLGAPIALISFVDTDRAWMKACYGLELSELPRKASFCGHVVADGEPLIVADALGDPRFADNPLVTGEPHVRFYAGVPLRTGDGHVLGALCVIDHGPKQPTPEQIALLAKLARQVVVQLDARREHLQLAVERAAALASSRNLAALFEAMDNGVVLHDGDGVITTGNAAAERILGVTIEQLAGRVSTDPRWRSIHEDGTPFDGENHPAMVTLRTGASCSSVVMGVYKPAGELTWISVNSVPLRGDSEGQPPYGVLATFHDITAIKAAQEASARLALQEHLVTTGTLVAGIGHEINNPLTYVHANVEMLIEEMGALAGEVPSTRLLDLVKMLHEAREGADRIRKIVAGLKAISRADTMPTPTDVDEVIDMSIHIAAHEIRHRATITMLLTKTPPVLADDSRLTQVLVNLLVNAAQAFTTGDVEKNAITISSAQEDNGDVSITVSDNGPGIPAELQRRIFDPFFTTKPVGHGTGLGLSISRGIIRSLRGEITVESVVGHGTSFRVSLPAADPLVVVGQPTGRVQSRVRGRVLVIDDEIAILRSIRRVLQRDHEVIALDDARKASTLLESEETFDVIFCDITMPHMRGDELYARVKASNPPLARRFVFITGGAKNPTDTFLSEVPNERVEKPFNVDDLREIVRRFVDSGPSSR
jgi:PAS domain S-box-containing protein